MPSSRSAILAERQVVCNYHGRKRELCPHIIGTNKNGEEVVLAWQFAGESSGPLPQWRCLRLAMSEMPVRAKGLGMKEVHIARNKPASTVSISISMFTSASCGR
jgi:hypothetical protein